MPIILSICTSLILSFSVILPVFSLYAEDFSSNPRIDCGIVLNSEITEASGIALSKTNQDVLWTHNDSGDSSRLFAIGVDGRHLGEFSFKGLKARDWEDIAVGPGPETGQSYIYIGEIGDNRAKFQDKYVYRTKEPVLGSKNKPTESVITDFDILAFRFPDGNRDAETVMVDPLTKDIYIVSKRESQVRIYRAPYPQPVSKPFFLEFLTTIPMTNINSGDISPSGTGILLKTYTSIYYWKRDPSLPLWKSFENEPVRLPYTMEPQGEAVCWDKDGSGYYTISEKRGRSSVHLYYYPKVVDK